MFFDCPFGFCVGCKFSGSSWDGCVCGGHCCDCGVRHCRAFCRLNRLVSDSKRLGLGTHQKEKERIEELLLHIFHFIPREREREREGEEKEKEGELKRRRRFRRWGRNGLEKNRSEGIGSLPHHHMARAWEDRDLDSFSRLFGKLLVKLASIIFAEISVFSVDLESDRKKEGIGNRKLKSECEREPKRKKKFFERSWWEQWMRPKRSEVRSTFGVGTRKKKLRLLLLDRMPTSENRKNE